MSNMSNHRGISHMIVRSLKNLKYTVNITYHITHHKITFFALIREQKLHEDRQSH